MHLTPEEKRRIRQEYELERNSPIGRFREFEEFDYWRMMIAVMFVTFILFLAVW